MNKIVKDKKQKALLKKNNKSRSQLKSFSSKQKQSFTKDKILNCHFIEKLAITKIGLNGRKEILLHTLLKFSQYLKNT